MPPAPERRTPDRCPEKDFCCFPSFLCKVPQAETESSPSVYYRTASHSYPAHYSQGKAMPMQISLSFLHFPVPLQYPQGCFRWCVPFPESHWWACEYHATYCAESARVLPQSSLLPPAWKSPVSHFYFSAVNVRWHRYWQSSLTEQRLAYLCWLVQNKSNYGLWKKRT